MTSTQPSTVRVNDVDLAYVEQGQGDSVVLVHGGVNDYRSWRRQMEPFAARRRVIAYSRRYHWPNARPDGDVPYRLAQHVADLGSLIETLDLAPARLVGSSYGAMTSLTFAVRRPELVRSLVLGEPPLLLWLPQLPGGSELLESFLTNGFGPAREALARGEGEAGVRLFINAVLGPGMFDRLPEPTREMMVSNVPEMRLETATPLEEYLSDVTPEDVERVEIPTLLVVGEISPAMFPLITDELARRLPNAERATIPGASHGMHGQNPAAYNEVVSAFLARH
ncbi:MAG TPA: alpha/beta hydrolase [Thermomicrobiales bacterium]|nr:alpha/beta hydrolase [Thermomicrobiales bacterium]